MIKKIINLIELPIINNLLRRLVNKYTASGMIIVIMQLEWLGILPSGITKAVEGVQGRDLALYVMIAIGIYLIVYRPKFKSKLEKIKLEIEIEKAKRVLKKIKDKMHANK